MPLIRIQELLGKNFNALDRIRRLILQRRTTADDLINQLDESNDRVSWYTKHLELHRKHESNMPKYTNRYEVFECEFGHNIKQEINKRRPCVIIGSYSSVVLVVPIMHKSMISFDASNRTIEMPDKNGGSRWKRIPEFTFPVEQDTTFRPGANPNWQQKTLNGCIELGHIRVVSKIRLSKMPIGKISQDNINELNQRLFNFLNIRIEDLPKYDKLKCDNVDMLKDIEQFGNEKEELIRRVEELTTKNEELESIINNLNNNDE